MDTNTIFNNPTIEDKTTTTNRDVTYLDDYRTTPNPGEVARPYIDQALLAKNLKNYYVYNSNIKSYDYSKNTKGGDDMSEINWQDKYLTSLDSSVKEINQSLTNTENRISEMINKHIANSTHLDKQRHEESLNLNGKIDKSIGDINSKIDATNKWIIGLVITTIVGVAAMFIGVAAMVISSM